MININWTNYNLNIHVERIVISLPIELSTEELPFFGNVHRYNVSTENTTKWNTWRKRDIVFSLLVWTRINEDYILLHASVIRGKWNSL